MPEDGISRRETLRAVGGGLISGPLVGAETGKKGGKGDDKGKKDDNGKKDDKDTGPSDEAPSYAIGFTHDVDLPQEKGKADKVFYSWDWGPAIGKTVVGLFGKGQLEKFRKRDDVRYVSETVEPTLVSSSHTDWGTCPDFLCCEYDYQNDSFCCNEYPKDDGSSWSDQCLPWGLDRIGAPDAHAAGNTGSGVDVAIIDTGVDMDHPDVSTNLTTPHYSCSGDTADDDDGHGTHTAGLAAAPDNSSGTLGVAPDANIHAADVFGCNGSATVADAIRWAADNNFDVINMSLSFYNQFSGNCGDTLGEYVPEVHDACVYAFYGHDADSDTTKADPTKGSFIAASAGNDGTGDCDTTSDPPDCCGYSCDCICPPGAYHAVHTVAATGYDSDNDEDYHAEFSSCGPQVDITAPGKLVASSYSPVDGSCDESDYSGCGSDSVTPYYARLSGTSMSSPIVAGAASVLMAQGYTAEQAKQVMNRTAEDIGLIEDMQGNGLVDIGTASGANYTGPVLVVNDRPEVDSANGEVTFRGQFMGASPSDVDTAGFKWRLIQEGSNSVDGEWQEWTTDPSSEQYNTTVAIDTHDTTGTCHAYEYKAFVDSSTLGESDESRGLKFWSDHCCLGTC